jgi:hypothetical protein
MIMKLLNSSGLRLGFAIIVALMVISSPIVMFINPVLASPSPSDDGSNSAPSTISQDGSDFTTQAALSSLSARPTNNIVNTNSFYDIVFLTATSGAIKFIQVTFPAGTIVPTSAIFNEAEGIGAGFISQISGQTVTYTVNNAVNVPAGTKIRLEFANINNPLNPSANYKVTVTTRNAANGVIDGPTQSTAYTMKQIGSNAIAESFMKKVRLTDSAAGHAFGWDPNGNTQSFGVDDPAVSPGTSLVSITVDSFGSIGCFISGYVEGRFFSTCEFAPAEGSVLDYVVINLPTHVS